MKEEKVYDEEMTFVVLDERGIEVKCEVLADFYDQDAKRTYIAYTDYLFDEENKLNIYASEIIASDNGFQLMDIHDQEIISKIQEVIDSAKK